MRMRRGEWWPALRTVVTTPGYVGPVIISTAVLVLVTWALDEAVDLGISLFVPAASCGVLLGMAMADAAARERRRRAEGEAVSD